MARTARPKAKVVKDYTLHDNDGAPVGLSSIFGEHDILVILHNMGKDCPNCALWGDEFNGMRKHLENQAAFCVVGPDDPKTQKRYVRERGWKTKLYSAHGTPFIKDLGFEQDGAPTPGVSVLRKRKDRRIEIVKQIDVTKDGRAPSVLEVFWMTPGVNVEHLAWGKT